MMPIRCAYCNREMKVSFLEFKTNKFCNLCFDDRADNSGVVKKEDRNKIVFMGLEIDLSDKKDKPN